MEFLACEYGCLHRAALESLRSCSVRVSPSPCSEALGFTCFHCCCFCCSNNIEPVQERAEILWRLWQAEMPDAALPVPCNPAPQRRAGAAVIVVAVIYRRRRARGDVFPE